MDRPGGVIDDLEDLASDLRADRGLLVGDGAAGQGDGIGHVLAPGLDDADPDRAGGAHPPARAPARPPARARARPRAAAALLGRRRSGERQHGEPRKQPTPQPMPMPHPIFPRLSVAR